MHIAAHPPKLSRRPRLHKVEVLDRLAQIARRVRSLTPRRPGRFAPPADAVEALRLALGGLAAELDGALTELTGSLEGPGTLADVLRTLAWVEGRRRRALAERLRRAAAASIDEKLEACRQAQEHLLAMTLGLEAELAAALGRPSLLSNLREEERAGREARAQARRELGNQIEDLTSLGAPIEQAQSVLSCLSSTIFDPRLGFGATERRSVRDWCRRALEMLWSTPPALRDSQARELLADARAFAWLIQPTADFAARSDAAA